MSKEYPKVVYESILNSHQAVIHRKYRVRVIQLKANTSVDPLFEYETSQMNDAMGAPVWEPYISGEASKVSILTEVILNQVVYDLLVLRNRPAGGGAGDPL